MSCNIPVRVISLSEQEFATAERKILDVGSFSDVKRWRAVRGKDLFNDDMSLRNDYRQILSERYPDVFLPETVSLLSPQAEKSLRYGQKSNVYDYHNAGAVGCALSHISLWQHMVSNNIPEMIIFESDVAFKNVDFCATLQTILENVGNFDSINFNLLPIPFPFNDHTELIDADNDLVQVKGIAFRLQGYLLTNLGAKKLIGNAFPLTYEIDSYLTVQTILPSSDFSLLATKEPLLDHPLVVLDSSIGYSPVQCITDGMFFVPQMAFVILLALLLLFILVIIGYAVYKTFFVKETSSPSGSSIKQ